MSDNPRISAEVVDLMEKGRAYDLVTTSEAVTEQPRVVPDQRETTAAEVAVIVQWEGPTY